PICVCKFDFAFFFQVAYLRIYFKLRYRFAGGYIANDDNSTRRQLRGRKLQRTNILLVSIAVIFCISWLPLNMFNLIADLWDSVDFTSQEMMIVYAVCHMMGMSSACSNPVLYGWLNDNFWKEFKDILCFPKTRIEKAGERKTSIKRIQKIPDNKKCLLSVPMENHQGTITNATEMSVLKC
ncbi:neuropeptide F receptor-like, partial [Agrilus planipennis]|uniref:Neuropeptide F receptor-like n=1 Tax=Agrilus planipennis TaxID=224129 RepID=A0A7F5RID3_AGRPL